MMPLARCHSTEPITGPHTCRYDYFLGDNQNSSETTLQAKFQTTSSDLKNGWTATACNTSYAAVCMIPMSAFPCQPPPSPPPPPPSPPSPPSPPAQLACELDAVAFGRCNPKPLLLSFARSCKRLRSYLRTQTVMLLTQARPRPTGRTSATPAPATATRATRRPTTATQWLFAKVCQGSWWRTAAGRSSCWWAPGLELQCAWSWVVRAHPQENACPLQVERYFRSQGQLPSPSYWLGAARESPSEKFGLSDGTAIPQVRGRQAREPRAMGEKALQCGLDRPALLLYHVQAPSNIPYAHWSWNFINASMVSDYNCVTGVGELLSAHRQPSCGPAHVHPPEHCSRAGSPGKRQPVLRDPAAAAAAAADTYDWWLGNASISAQQQNSSFYQTTNTNDNKYGWVPAACNASLPFICEFASSAYACPPPWPPPPPPPLPPSPPSPPIPPTCAPVQNSTFFCETAFHLFAEPASPAPTRC
jgi:hypothetical protein